MRLYNGVMRFVLELNHSDLPHNLVIASVVLFSYSDLFLAFTKVAETTHDTQGASHED